MTPTSSFPKSVESASFLLKLVVWVDANTGTATTFAIVDHFIGTAAYCWLEQQPLFVGVESECRINNADLDVGCEEDFSSGIVSFPYVLHPSRRSGVGVEEAEVNCLCLLLWHFVEAFRDWYLVNLVDEAC